MLREAARLAGAADPSARGNRHRELMAARSRAHSLAVADIGEIPPVANPERRERCRLDLLAFLQTYFPASTGLKPFSDDHLRVIGRIQRCVLEGGRFVNAMPRGFAKTTISENAAIWATIYGHRRFVPIFGADAAAAESNVGSLKLELSENDLLAEDFPEVCHAIRALGGKAQRCQSQTYHGVLTHIGWRADEIVLPTIPGSRASGAILTARGIEGGCRGMKHKRPDGTQQRPDFVIIDDPQTDASAATPLQIEKRMSVISKSILKLGGHDQMIACVVNATVIRPNDLIEQLLDTKKHAVWQGERIKMVRNWSAVHETLWLGDYARIRNTYDAASLGDQQRAHREATEFYRLNREKMDAGCEVSWEHCFDPALEVSAVQHAYNSLIDDGEEVFASECQNSPIEEKVEDDALQLRSDDVAAKVNKVARGELPIEVTRLVAFIDPKKDLLLWSVLGFADGFSGAVVDYGAFPDQRRRYFSARKPSPKLGDLIKADSWEAVLYGGLDALVNLIAGREWVRTDGTKFKIERILIDHGWGEAADTVDLFCRQSTHSAILLPSKGVYCGATSRPFNDLAPKPGERRGTCWRIPVATAKGSGRQVLFDSNWWKTFVVNRFKVPMGGRGCLSLFGDKPEPHQLFADHIVSEKPVAVEAKGRRVIEWKQSVNLDNDLLDCVVGCHVAAAVQGVSLHERKTVTRRVVSVSELKKKAKRWDAKTKDWVNHG
jgi:hypothetical protein